MSVTIGKPVRARTSARIRSPSSRPGPRNEAIDVRFALSYDALKTTATPQRAATSRMASAVSSACDSLSMTHGPRMKASGCPPPTENDPIRTGFTVLILSVRRSRDVHRIELSSLMPIARLDEARKQRMRSQRLRLELRMELPRDEPRMRGEFRNLDELPIRGTAGYLHAVLRQRGLIEAVELETMTMALVDEI